jgi:polyhydroxybutyrate depolymerase
LPAVAVILAPLVALGLALAGAARAPAAAMPDEHVTVGGYDRTYHVYAPASRPAAPALVVVLHGGFGSGAQAEAAYHWDALADRAGFVVLYPDGLQRAWNAGDCCGEPRARGVDDVAFIEAAVRATARAYATDPARLYITGISNGGMMAYRLACESALPVAAVAPVAAALPVACEHPQRVSLLHVHGLADRNVPIAGGPGSGFAHVTYRPVSAGLAVFRNADRCGPPVTTTAGPVTTSRSACDGGRVVQLTTIAGAGHQWPGGAPPPARAAALLRLDPPSTALDATALIWAFFDAAPR